jgi:hypothetical protein
MYHLGLLLSRYPTYLPNVLSGSVGTLANRDYTTFLSSEGVVIP